MSSQQPGGPKGGSSPEKEALNRGLSELLSVLELDEGVFTFTNFKSVDTFAKLLNRRDPWRSHLSTVDVFRIVGNFVEAALPHQPEKPTGPLKQLITAGASADLHTAISDYLRSLPRKYELWIELPSMPPWGAGDIALSKAVAFVETAAEEPGPTQLGDIANALSKLITRPKPGMVHVKVLCAGFAIQGSGSTAAADGASKLKVFLSAMEARDLFKRAYYPQVLTPQATAWLIDLSSDSTRKHIPAAVPDSLKHYLAHLMLDEEKLTVYDYDGSGKGAAATILGAVSRAAHTREEKERALKTAVSDAARLLDAAEENVDAARVRTALEWSFDSRHNDNETLAILQACIGLESLLGEDDQDEPLTARLADRCAFLLGRSSADREAIRTHFKKMYGVRSKLIHGRRQRLEVSEEELLWAAQRLLADVVDAEAANVFKALNRAEERARSQD